MPSSPLSFGSRPVAALVVLWCVVASGTAAAQMVGSAHDFVDNGFTGGGVCAACHIPHNAQDVRLYPRNMTASSFDAPQRLCMDCHTEDTDTADRSDGTRTGRVPTGTPGWPSTWDYAGHGPPIPGAHVDDIADDNEALTCRDQGQQDCGTCHVHQSAFVFVGGCFDCHATEAEQLLARGEVVFPDATEQCMQVDREFDGIGAVANAALLSQHNVVDTKEDCQKCHGSGHPGDAGLLVYPDTVGANSMGTLIPRSNDFSTYQDFCLACHDGVQTHVAARTTFGGPLGTNQVAPSLRSNPALQQLGPTWVVPAIPPKDGVAGENLPPFLDYYETNGHGAAAAPLTSRPMNVSCLAGGGQGCHVAHGSQNRFLIDDGFGPGIVSASQVAVELCYACHLPGVLIGAGTVSTFHGWVGNDTILHDDTLDATADGMSQMRVLAASMDITALPGASPPPVSAGILPFYGAIDGAVQLRKYPGDMNAGGPYWVNCLSCHDPHGTGLATQAAMTRIDPDFATYDDLYLSPLCKECHN